MLRLHKEAELEEVQQSPRLLLHKKQPLICFRATAGCRTAARFVSAQEQSSLDNRYLFHAVACWQ